MSALDGEDVASRLAAWLAPRLSGEVTVELLGVADGGSSDTSFLTVRAAGANAMQLVLRREPRDYRVYPDPELDKQVGVLRALAACGGVPVPEVRWFEPDPDVIGTPFFLMSRLGGDAIPNLPSYSQEGWLADATPAQRERLWRSSVAMLARIHQVEPARFGFLARPVDGANGLEQELRYWDRYLAIEVAQPPHPLLPIANRWLAENLPDARPTRFSWGDARLGNMLYRDFECVCVLDFETASLAGPEADLGWWLFFDEMYCTGMGLARLEGLGDRQATIALWESLMGRPAQNMHFYDVLAAFRVALAIERTAMLRAQMGVAEPVGAGDDNPAIRQLARLLDMPIGGAAQ